MELFFTLFTLDHNAICDALKQAYPEWSDDNLFEHARLVNAALLVKIHTVEWTTAILVHPALQIGMRANWWGLPRSGFISYSNVSVAANELVEFLVLLQIISAFFILLQKNL